MLQHYSLEKKIKAVSMYFIFCIRQNQNILIKLSIFSSLETENEAETSIYILKDEQI